MDEDVELGSSEQELISDQLNNNGKKGFFFLPPVVLLPVISLGSFESRLAPVVRIDELNAQGAATRTVATYTGTTSVFGEKLLRNLTANYYTVRFNSSSANLDPAKTYRIQVLPAAGVAALGYADIDVVSSALELLTVNRSKFTPLLKGGTLAIRFRIEKPAVDSDGDGVFDWLDNCPSVKNPPVKTSADVAPATGTAPASCKPELTACDPREQPVNPATFTQPDSDGDGIGDACDCPKGYNGGNGVACTDINECTAGTSSCNPATQLCQNTPGSFSCTTCPVNTKPQNGSCVATQTPCPAGYTGFVETGCTDIDECATGASTCNVEFQICVNTPGSSSCQNCALPHERPINGSCVNIDECQLGTVPDTCTGGTFCSTSFGGNYFCQPKYGSTCVCNDGVRLTGGCDKELDCNNPATFAGERDVLIRSCTPVCAPHGGIGQTAGGTPDVCFFNDTATTEITCGPSNP